MKIETEHITISKSGVLRTRTMRYRFGFNGREMDNEVSGTGNQYDYGFRIYNPRLGRFLSVDLLTKSYPWYTPYQFAGNKPIVAIDLDGLEEFFSIEGEVIGVGNKTDKRKMLVLTPETAKNIKNMTEEQRVAVLNDKPFDIIMTPTSVMINQMQETLKKGNKIEHGFAYGIDPEGNVVVSKIYEGTTEGFNPTEAIAELKAMNGVKVLGVVHSHPTSYMVTETDANGRPLSIKNNAKITPSDVDNVNQQNRLNDEIVQQAGAVLGQDNRLVDDMSVDAPIYGQQPKKVVSPNKVTFYGGKKSESVTIDIDKLKKVSKKIYEK